jgi:hypothetical protein
VARRCRAALTMRRRVSGLALFPGARIHGNHLWGVRVPINSLCVFSSMAPSPFRWLLTGQVNVTLRFFLFTTCTLLNAGTKTNKVRPDI